MLPVISTMDDRVTQVEGFTRFGVGYPSGVINFCHPFQPPWCPESRISLLLLLMLSIPSVKVLAQDPQEADPPPPSNLEVVNDFHSRVGARIFKISDRVDDFFGDRRMEDEPVETRLRVRSQFRLYEGGRSEVKFKIRANAVLPRTQQRLGFFVESLREDFLTDFSQVLGDESSEQSSDNPLADDNVSGLRLSLFKDAPGKWTLDGGVKISSDPKTRVRLRWQYDWQAFEKWNMRVVQGFEYREELGPGLRTQLRWERLISDRLLRISLEGVRFDEDPAESLFSIDHYLPLSEDSTVRITASELGFLGSGAELDGSSLEVAWRKKVLFDWLFAEVAPKMFWSDDPEEGREYSTFLALEVVFVN